MEKDIKKEIQKLEEERKKIMEEIQILENEKNRKYTLLVELQGIIKYLKENKGE